MEVYAGYLTYTDFEVGHLINHLKEINQLDNTLVVLMIGDNGASKEGLELLGIKAPEQIRGIKQQPIEGTSLAYSIDDAKAPSRHTVQYYYIYGARSIYKDGWKAELAYPSSFITGNFQSKAPFDENAWELYNLNEDYTERIDLAKKYPEKLAELKALFEEQAKSHNLYPYITWDDVFSGRIHRTPGSKSFAEAVKDVTKPGDN